MRTKSAGSRDVVKPLGQGSAHLQRAFQDSWAAKDATPASRTQFNAAQTTVGAVAQDGSHAGLRFFFRRRGIVVDFLGKIESLHSEKSSCAERGYHGQDNLSSVQTPTARN